MKVGIIVPCNSDEKDININAFKRCLRGYDDFHLCFVNNTSKDKTLELLYKFKEEFKTRIAIINMKKNVSTSMAIRAGARYYYSIPTITYVGYLDVDLSVEFEDFEELKSYLKQNRKLKLIFGEKQI